MRPSRSARSLSPPNRVDAPPASTMAEVIRGGRGHRRPPARHARASGRGSSARGRGRRPSGAAGRGRRGPRGSPARTGGWCRSRRGRRPGSAARAAAIDSARRTRSRYVGAAQARSSSSRTIRPVGASARTPSGGQPAARAASASAGRRRDRRARPRAGPSPRASAGGGPDAAPASRIRSPSRASVAVRDERVDHDVRHGRRGVATRGSRGGARRGRRPRAASGSGTPVSSGCAGMVGGDERERPRAQGRVDVRGEAPVRRPRGARRGGRAEPRSEPTGARGQRRRPFRRQPTARDAAWRRRVEHDAPAGDRAGRGPAKREPVARARRRWPRRGAGSRATVPSARSIASRGPRTTSALGLRPCRGGGAGARDRPGVRRAVAGPRMATRIRDVATTPGSVVRTCPRRRRSPSIPPTSSAVRPPATAVDRSRRGPGPRGRAARRRRARAAASIPVVDRPAAQAAGHDRPATLDREHAVDREARPACRPRQRRAPEAPASAAIARRHAVDPRRRSSRTPTSTGDPGERRRREQGRGPRPRPRRDARLVDQVGLRHDGEPVADPERVEEPEVLERLGVRPVVGGDDEQRGVDLAGADEHVADEPVVPRHVDEVDDRPVRQREVRVADVDRHARAAAPRGGGRRRCR